MSRCDSLDINEIPPGHEKVSDDLIIYSLPNWREPPERADAARSDSSGLGFAAACIPATILLLGFLLL